MGCKIVLAYPRAPFFGATRLNAISPEAAKGAKHPLPTCVLRWMPVLTQVSLKDFGGEAWNATHPDKSINLPTAVPDVAGRALSANLYVLYMTLPGRTKTQLCKETGLVLISRSNLRASPRSGKDASKRSNLPYTEPSIENCLLHVGQLMPTRDVGLPSRATDLAHRSHHKYKHSAWKMWGPHCNSRQLSPARMEWMIRKWRGRSWTLLTPLRKKRKRNLEIFFNLMCEFRTRGCEPFCS